MGDPVALCQAIAHVTNEVHFGTSVQPIYFRNPVDMASTAAFIHEISGGRFWLGIGVTHGPVHERLGITPGKPLADIREYIAAMEAASAQHGDLPPIVLATLRQRMAELSAEISSVPCGQTRAATTSVTPWRTSVTPRAVTTSSWGT